LDFGFFISLAVVINDLSKKNQQKIDDLEQEIEDLKDGFRRKKY
jgi:hypothetical protein